MRTDVASSVKDHHVRAANRTVNSTAIVLPMLNGTFAMMNLIFSETAFETAYIVQGIKS
jgi:hypothetical protein